MPYGLHSGLAVLLRYRLVVAVIAGIAIGLVLGRVPLSADGRVALSGKTGDLIPVSGEDVGSADASAPVVVVPGVERPGRRYFLSSFKLPEAMTFAGQAIPLDNWQVRERIEYEFYQFLASAGESIILAKRTGRCFPMVERQLAAAGLPDDLKYLLLIESRCIASTSSSLHAAGRRKLARMPWRDDRRDLELSIEASIKRLRGVKQTMGEWFVALASYQGGEDQVKRALAEQRVSDYWMLHISRDTMRYIPRIIAAKEIYSQPQKYLGLTKKDLYVPVETETVTITVRQPQRHLADVAQEFGSYFLEMKLLNPEITKEYLPRGEHRIKIPKSSKTACPLGCLQQAPLP